MAREGEVKVPDYAKLKETGAIWAGKQGRCMATGQNIGAIVLGLSAKIDELEERIAALEQRPRSA